MTTNAIPDDVLELIFLRLDSPLCLLSAATTCKQWRRIVAGAGFLRRFHSFNGPPPVAGIYYDRPCHPRQRPDLVVSPWVDIDGRFFSLDFLPDSQISPWVWRIQDSRGSLLLFDRLRHPQGSASYGHIVICEPLTRRYEIVDPLARFKGYSFSNAYLIDGESGGIGIENFRVVFRLHVRGIHSDAGMFTMGINRQQSWRKISINELMRNAGPSSELIPSCVYWFNLGRAVTALDRRTGEFSSILLPEVDDWDYHKEMYDLVVTAGHDGTARIVLSGASGDLMVFARLQSSGEWALAKRIRLSTVIHDLPGYDPWFFFSESALVCSAGTPVILLSPWRMKKWWFYLDVDTTEVAPAPDPDVATAYPCELPWPPTLHACTSGLDV
ncbi:hypothetical protein BAE44_0000047 [Dichanthelium oligosanthes]|uniref:F-box domain-containing protein n=1 Tax=Dichanthelium oligosanthes TaxID=888268 RepID=A0A1E5WNH1_9POAL|nr:hypothetical protein BAE44_0000047 [Dichanthelium oligosanthes]